MHESCAKFLKSEPIILLLISPFGNVDFKRQSALKILAKIAENEEVLCEVFIKSLKLCQSNHTIRKELQERLSFEADAVSKLRYVPEDYGRRLRKCKWFI